MSIHKNEKDGTWYLKKRIRKIDGSIVNTTKRGFRTKKEAQHAEAMLCSSGYTPKIKLVELCNEYLKYNESKYKFATLYGKKIIIEKYITKYFGEINPEKITNIDILNWQKAIQREKISIGRINKITSELKSIFEFGEKFYNLKNNPARTVGSIKNTSVTKTAMKVWTPEEFDKFINCCRDNIMYYTFFNVLYYTGTRKGEALALTWEDINFYSKSIRISKAITQKHKNADTTYSINTPKTASGVRTISLPQGLCDILEKYKEYRYKSEGKLLTSDLLFNTNGKPISETSLERYKNAKCKEAGVKQIRIHDFRHSHASLLINMGITPLFISERLGHADVSTTLDVYSHLFPTNQKEITDMLDKIIK